MALDTTLVLVPDDGYEAYVRAAMATSTNTRRRVLVRAIIGQLESCVREARQCMGQTVIAVLTRSHEDALRALCAGADDAMSCEAQTLSATFVQQLVERAHCRALAQAGAGARDGHAANLEHQGQQLLWEDSLHEVTTRLTHSLLSLQWAHRELGAATAAPGQDGPRSAIGRQALRGREEALPQTLTKALAMVTQALEASTKAEKAMRSHHDQPEDTDLVACLERVGAALDRRKASFTPIDRRYGQTPVAVQVSRDVLTRLLAGLFVHAEGRHGAGRSAPGHACAPIRVKVHADENVASVVIEHGTAQGDNLVNPGFLNSDADFEPLLGTREKLRALGGDLRLENRHGDRRAIVASIPLAKHTFSGAPDRSGTVRIKRFVLLVEPEPLVRGALTQLLSPQFHVEAVDSDAQAIAMLRAGKRPDCIVAAHHAVHGRGPSLSSWLTEHRPELSRRLLLLAAHEEELRKTAGIPCLRKPIEPAQLLAAIDQHCRLPLRKAATPRKRPVRLVQQR